MNGMIQETSKKRVLNACAVQDEMMEDGGNAKSSKSKNVDRRTKSTHDFKFILLISRKLNGTFRFRGKSRTQERGHL